MKLFLLDTHALLWLISEPERLPARVRDALLSAENVFFFSIVSLWEMTIKAAKGTLHLPAQQIKEVAEQIEARGITLLPFEVEDLAALQTLRFLHRDPFDRALVAQARRHDATLVTVDQVLEGYGVEVLWS